VGPTFIVIRKEGFLMISIYVGIALLVGMLWGFWGAWALYRAKIRQAAASDTPINLMDDGYVYFVHRYKESPVPGDWVDP
jgi:hypothetical protein